jgi:F0F1-type ATP synthase assembly protein I
MSTGRQPERLTDETDDRSAFAKAYDAATQLIAICAMVSLPAGAGYLLDRWVGTGFLFAALGLLFGLFAAIRQFMRMLRRIEAEQVKNDDTPDRQKKVD